MANTSFENILVEKRTGLCAYVDILGQRNNLLDIQKNPLLINEEIERISMFQEICKRYSGYILDEVSENPIQIEYHSISDSMFILYLERNPPPENILESQANLLLASAMGLGLLQLTLLLNKMFIRGGISMGLIGFADNVLLGTPVARSVMIEDEIAIFPSIVLCDSLDMALQEIINSELSETLKSAIADQFVLREDGRVAINPFGSVFGDRDDGESSSPIDELIQINIEIRRQLMLHQENLSIRPKYTYLRDLWNFTILNAPVDKEHLIPLAFRDTQAYTFRSIT